MMDYRSWHVGMKVVCLKDGGWELVSGPKRREVLPLKGGIYSISYIEADDELVFIALAECEPTALFLADHFRPLDARKTNLSIFTALLTKAPTPEKEPA